MRPVTIWLALGACVLQLTVSLAQDLSGRDKKGIGARERKLYRLDPQTPEGLQELLSFSGTPLPIVSGHRGGAWKGFPENCIATFERTLEQTFAMLEIDPRTTSDGKIVVHHDATLQRTTTGEGRVADLTLTELKQLRLKDRDGQVTEFQVPTLDEVIEWRAVKPSLCSIRKMFRPSIEPRSSPNIRLRLTRC